MKITVDLSREDIRAIKIWDASHNLFGFRRTANLMRKLNKIIASKSKRKASL